VIAYADVDELQGVLQPPGDDLVGGRGLGDAAGVRVGEDDGGGIAAQGLLDHFARMDRGAVDGAVEQLDEFDDPVCQRRPDIRRIWSV